MRAFKTDLYKISFTERTDKVMATMHFERIHKPALTLDVELHSLEEVCSNVKDKMQAYLYSPEEAVKVVSKAAAFFLLSQGCY